MVNTKKINELLYDIRNLMSKHEGMDKWINSFDKFVKQWESTNNLEEKKEVAQIIKGVYGGMGSFNDIVLQSGSNFYPEDNNKLDNMRHKLYELIMEIKQGNE